MSDTGKRQPLFIVSLTDRAADACDAAGCHVSWVAAFISEAETCKWWENEGGPEHCRAVIFGGLHDARTTLAKLREVKGEGAESAVREIEEVLQTEAIRNDYYGSTRFDLYEDDFGPVGFPADYTPEGEEEEE